MNNLGYNKEHGEICNHEVVIAQKALSVVDAAQAWPEGHAAASVEDESELEDHPVFHDFPALDNY